MVEGQTRDDDWEIPAMFPVPRRMDVVYNNLAELVNPSTLDSLTKMMWHYPRFFIEYIKWKGPIDDQWDDYQKATNHPNRVVAIALLTLLKVLPVDLVRGVLADFLI